MTVGVKLVAGVLSTGGAADVPTNWVQIRETSEWVRLDKNYNDAWLTISEARQLARQLYALARRVEKRTAPMVP